MPEITDEQFDMFLELIKNATPLTLNVSKYDEEEAESICDEYLKNKNISVNNMSPLTIYYIIKKLNEEEQINFIKTNINYIKNHDEEIFLYNMLSPNSLSYYLSLNVLKEIYNLDKSIFKKIINGNHENLVHGFNEQDYMEFYNSYSEELKETKNLDFINGLYYHNRHCYDEQFDISKAYENQRIYNKEFIKFILIKYQDKINTFNNKELLRFITYIEDLNVYENFIKEQEEKLVDAFTYIEGYELNDYLSETNEDKQEILIEYFFDKIITKQDIKKVIYKLRPKIILELYNEDKKTFNKLTLKDWIKYCSINRILNDEFKNILDTFNIDDIKSLFDTNFYVNSWYNQDIKALKYIEIKYRTNIETNGKLEDINEISSIFSDKYFKNLKELNQMLKTNLIDKTNIQYKKHLSLFILYLQTHNIIFNLEGNNFKEIEKLFYRIVSGLSLTVVYQVSSIEDITILNRLGKMEFDTKEFTVEQIEKYNVKQHKSLYKNIDTDSVYLKDYKKLILKLIFILGYNNSKKILEIDNSIPTLEHLVGNIDVKNIILDEKGNPILNTKIINLIFNDKDHKRIIKMLQDKDNELYKYFPRIFNEWEMLKLNNKDKSLSTIIDFLKSDDISLPPKYYRLEGLFKYIGCNNRIVNETLNIHDEILKRTSSTIPRIIGTEGEYSYEVLKLDDMKSLTVGNITDCCFTVLGNGYPCLKHATTNKNGRILVIKKNNQIIAHSWLWRNGDLLCLDNIEISKKISEIDFLNVYLKFANEIIKKSYQAEGINTCIKNITIGFTNFDKPIRGINNFLCLISEKCNLREKNFDKRLGKTRKILSSLPQPIEQVGYSDSKNVQYLIKGTGSFNLDEVYYYYQDERTPIMEYHQDNTYKKDHINQINKIINGLRYQKYESDNNLSNYKIIDIEDLQEAYCSNDWYIIIYQNGNTESYTYSYDDRVALEMENLKTSKAKTKVMI